MIINTTAKAVRFYLNDDDSFITYEPDAEHQLSVVVEAPDLLLMGKFPQTESADVLVSPLVALFITNTYHEVDGGTELVCDTLAAAGFRIYGLSFCPAHVVKDAQGEFLGSRSLVRYV